MTNKTYDTLKFLAQVLIPALATCIVAIFTIWNIPYGEAIGATLMAIDTLLGAILHSNGKKYFEEMDDERY